MKKPLRPVHGAGGGPAGGGGTGRGRGGAGGGVPPKPARSGNVPGRGRGGAGAGPVTPKKPVKRPVRKKPRKLSPGSDVACCSAQAVGTLAGWDWRRVLDLYWRTARDPDSGASIEDTVAAALDELSGLNLGVILGVELPGSHAIAVTPDGTWWSWGEPFNPQDWPDLVIEEAWWLP